MEGRRMGHVGIVSAAYWGDVMPFVPVAEELAARGHHVTLAVPKGFHEVLDAGPYELRHLGTDFSPRELADHGQVLDKADSPLGMRAAAQLWIRQLCIEPAESIVAVLEDIAPDLWFVHPSLYWLTEIATARSATPIVVGHLFPMMIPSAEQPPPSLPGSGGRRINRLGWWLACTMAGRLMYDREINRLRATRGLEPVVGNVGFGWQRARQTLVLTSEHYWPRPSDWPEQVATTGFTIWDGGGAALPTELASYLDVGPAPVLVTFGTSAATNAGDAFEQVAAAVEAVGHRTLLLVGNDRNRHALADRDGVWTFAPLPQVLTRCRAIVHAGGHGSTAAALHAGIPQLALPMGFDQIGHGERIRQLGVGTSLPFRRRSPSRLVNALHEALQDTCAATASRLVRRLLHEDGPATAADHLEAILADAEGTPHAG
jgi:UDP:flavonoid glycosyltransferase YjiC (YdhE family)